MTTDITNVLWFSNMHYILMMYKIRFVYKRFRTLVTGKPFGPFCRNLVDYQHMLIHEPCLDLLPTDWAYFCDMTTQEMGLDFGWLDVRERASIPGTLFGILWVRNEEEPGDSSLDLARTFLLMVLDVVPLQRFAALETESSRGGIPTIRILAHLRMIIPKFQIAKKKRKCNCLKNLGNEINSRRYLLGAQNSNKSALRTSYSGELNKDD